MHFISKPKEMCKPEQKEDNSQNLPMGLIEFMFWFISNENSGKQNSMNTLRAEINQPCVY